jgi:hypothetical protein
MTPQAGRGVQPKQIKKFLGEVSEDELSVRLIEAYAGIRRPAGKTAAQALADMDAQFPGMTVPARRQARAAVQYMAECFANARPPQ